MIVLFCGSQGWFDIEPIMADMRTLDPDSTIVVHGGAPGADLLADKAARLCKIHVAEVRALWGAFTRDTAGKWRNNAMMLLKPDDAYCYSMDTPGTSSMIGLLIQGRVPLHVRRPDGR